MRWLGLGLLAASAVLAAGAAAGSGPWVAQAGGQVVWDMGSRFQRSAGGPDAAGYRPVERLFLDVTTQGYPNNGQRRIEARRETIRVNCDWLTLNDPLKVQPLTLDGRDQGAPTAAKDYGDHFAFLGRTPDNLSLGLACGFLPVDGQTFATTAEALAFGLKAIPAEPTPMLPMLPIPAAPVRDGPMAWTQGDYWLAARGGQGQALFLERGWLVRDGDQVSLRALAVLPAKSGRGLYAAVRVLAYDCAKGEETVTRTLIFGDDFALDSQSTLTRQVKGLPATAAGLALACGPQDWTGRATQVAGGIPGAVAFARGGQ